MKSKQSTKCITRKFNSSHTPWKWTVSGTSPLPFQILRAVHLLLGSATKSVPEPIRCLATASVGLFANCVYAQLRISEYVCVCVCSVLFTATPAL